MVSERLEAVQKGLGEMQSLANGVNDFKGFDECEDEEFRIQLGNILEQIMSPEQYEANVKPRVLMIW